MTSKKRKAPDEEHEDARARKSARISPQSTKLREFNSATFWRESEIKDGDYSSSQSRTYNDIDSIAKEIHNFEFSSCVGRAIRLYGKCKTLVLDAQKLKTTHSLIKNVKQVPENHSVFELDPLVYQEQRRCFPKLCQEIKHVQGNIFDGLADCPRCIYLDMTKSDISAENLKKLQNWERGFGQEYHALFITICVRGKKGNKVEDRIRKFKKALSTKNFGLRVKRSYRRQAGRFATMTLLIFESK